MSSPLVVPQYIRRNAHERAERFASRYPDAERRRWAYQMMYRYALRHPEPAKR